MAVFLIHELQLWFTLTKFKEVLALFMFIRVWQSEQVIQKVCTCVAEQQDKTQNVKRL